MLWNKTYGGNGLDNASSIKTTADGGAAIAGFTMSKGAEQQRCNHYSNRQPAIHLDKNFEPAMLIRHICISPNGGYAIAGDSRSWKWR